VRRIARKGPRCRPWGSGRAHFCSRTTSNAKMPETSAENGDASTASLENEGRYGSQTKTGRKLKLTARKRPGIPPSGRSSALISRRWLCTNKVGNSGDPRYFSEPEEAIELQTSHPPHHARERGDVGEGGLLGGREAGYRVYEGRSSKKKGYCQQWFAKNTSKDLRCAPKKLQLGWVGGIGVVRKKAHKVPLGRTATRTPQSLVSPGSVKGKKTTLVGRRWKHENGDPQQTSKRRGRMKSRTQRPSKRTSGPNSQQN